MEHFRIDTSFWLEFSSINEYRNNSAHPNGKLYQDVAAKCRKVVLEEFMILFFKKHGGKENV